VTAVARPVEVQQSAADLQQISHVSHWFDRFSSPDLRRRRRPNAHLARDRICEKRLGIAHQAKPIASTWSPGAKASG
jgi:hypothetical protein